MSNYRLAEQRSLTDTVALEKRVICVKMFCHGHHVGTVETGLKIIGRKIFSAIGKIKGVGDEWGILSLILLMGKCRDHGGI